ncbi:thioredoxin, putative [Entamoeba dispar SAW760]|uniref:Thioredoxin n=1 Tax=Entamoeba dispar (strain ATCC PRA-260 / SAW760) TaxID=370354 RepID=B0EFZ8_ENTDS|nr:thioredoxin, putative [Entamoeba dispar SAW760]EDR26549.1 thioredoxin, putative [Entamoeba dispar SAW760]|eukprot:EDR26549.1 thioredoxin, putative [Entamoeba dispar SAW760]
MAVLHINALDQLTALLSTEKVIVIDFFATWCGPCRSIGPYFEELAGQHNNIKFVKVDVDQAEEICVNYKVRSMPTFVLVKDGIEQKRFSGADRNALKQMIETA